MRITDIIRGVLDLADMAGAASQPVTPAVIAVTEPAVERPIDAEQDIVSVIQKLAGMDTDCGCNSGAEYANEPNAVVAPIGAAFPGGDDVHARKNPSDIRTNAPSMYPGYQAGVK